MVICYLPLLIIATHHYFSRYVAFWICFLIGILQDLLILSLPFGFYTFLCPLMSGVWQLSIPFVPGFYRNSKLFIAIFPFCFVFSLIQSLFLSTFHHWIEDLFLGPLFDALIGMGILFVIQRFHRPKQEVDHATK